MNVPLVCPTCTLNSVISCVLLQHKREGISLSAAYHHTLSSFYSLRARAEHSRRSAVAEALAYGATFPIRYGKAEYQAGGAREVLRFTLREGKEIKSGAEILNPAPVDSADSGAAGTNQVAGGAGGVPGAEKRTNARLDTWTGGAAYVQASRAARDEARRVRTSSLSSSSSAPPNVDTARSGAKADSTAQSAAAEQIASQLSGAVSEGRSVEQQSARMQTEAAAGLQEQAVYEKVTPSPLRSAPASTGHAQGFASSSSTTSAPASATVQTVQGHPIRSGDALSDGFPAEEAAMGEMDEAEAQLKEEQRESEEVEEEQNFEEEREAGDLLKGRQKERRTIKKGRA